jgi:hypothetical protein
VWVCCDKIDLSETPRLLNLVVEKEELERRIFNRPVESSQDLLGWEGLWRLKVFFGLILWWNWWGWNLSWRGSRFRNWDGIGLGPWILVGFVVAGFCVDYFVAPHGFETFECPWVFFIGLLVSAVLGNAKPLGERSSG